MMSEKKAVDEPWLQEDLSATGTLCKRKNNMIPILETKPIVNQVVNQSYSKYLNRSNDNELNNKDVRFLKKFVADRKNHRLLIRN